MIFPRIVGIKKESPRITARRARFSRVLLFCLIRIISSTIAEKLVNCRYTDAPISTLRTISKTNRVLLVRHAKATDFNATEKMLLLGDVIRGMKAKNVNRREKLTVVSCLLTPLAAWWAPWYGVAS